MFPFDLPRSLAAMTDDFLTTVRLRPINGVPDAVLVVEDAASLVRED